MFLNRWLENVWYEGGAGRALLMPFSWLFGLVVGMRRHLYAMGLFRTFRVDVPVIVVGNLTTGGTGKTPLVIWLARRLSSRGMKPAVVSRGYGSGRSDRVRQARVDSDPATVGDEPVLIARRSGVPVVVASDRAAAADIAVRDGADVIIADDGLQHLRLERDFEIAVIDGRRRFGNGRLLPAGPLREGTGRLARVDAIVVNGGQANDKELLMHVDVESVVPLSGGDEIPLSRFSGQTVHAIAGIGNPGRFFNALRDHDITVRSHSFPDHAVYRRQDLIFDDGYPVLMTEKDAVKCLSFALENHWYVPVRAVLDELDARELLNRIDTVISHNRNELPGRTEP